MRNSFSVNFRRAASVIILTLGLAVAAQAQFRAGLQGTVTDPQGGAVVGATVTLTNKETNQTQESTSSDEGFYRFDRLAPGTYMLTAEMAGFKKKVLESVEIKAEVDQGVNIELEAGQISETVTISSSVGETLQTENANVGGSISEREIQRLPQIGRDPYELVRLTPGVFGLGARNATGGSQGLPGQVGPGGSNNQIFQTENQPAVSAGGQRPEANNFQIDGVNAMSQAWGGAAVVTPNQESVKEVRVVANNYSAEFGRNSGAQVLIVSQTGTNDFHGSLFFKRNTPGMNSCQDYGDFVVPRAASDPNPCRFLVDRTRTAIREDPQRVNQFLSQYGGSIGGPILKNRLFGFFSYETVRSSNNRVETLWIETPQFVTAVNAARAGTIANTVLSFPGMTPPRVAAVVPQTCGQYGIGDPTRCQQLAGGLDIGSITGAPGLFVNDGVGGGLDGIPDVQFAAIDFPSSNTAEQFNVRIDYQVTKNDLVAFSTYFVPNDSAFNDAWGNRGRPGLDFVSGRRNMVGTLLWTRTLSSSMVNEARFNVTRWYFDEAATNPDVGYGIPMLRVFGNQFISFGQHVGPGVFYQNTYNFRDVLSKVTGAHALKFGADIVKEQNNDKAPWAGRPTFEFNNLWSFANDAPQVESAFYDPSTGDFTDLAAYPRSTYVGLFVQDDWKVRPNLSVNIGLRWDYYSPLRSKRDRISNLILGPDGGLIGSSIKVGGDLYEKDWNNFGPQIGVAWSPKTIFGQDVENKMVIRGGFGIGYNRLPGSRLLESRFNPPFFASFFFDRNSGNIVYRTAADLNSFDYPPNPNARLTFDPATGLPIGPSVGFNATAQELPNPMVYRFSFDAEYEIGKGWIASLGYQGTRGRNLPRPVPYNLLVPDSPNFGGVTLLLADARSNFNALLVEGRRRFSNSFQFAAEYRLASSKDTCSSDHDCRATYPFDQDTEYGPSSFDVKHSFKAYGVWALPFFRNRNDWKGKVLGGFELSGILTASSGFPWTAVVGGGQCGAVVSGGQGICPLRPIAQLRDPTGGTSNSTFLGAGQFPGGGLTYFTPPPAGNFTTPPRPGIGRNSFRGPNYFSVDTTVVKRFGLPVFPVLGENAGIEIRFNVYNLFNRMNLSPFGINDDNTQIQHPDFGRALHVLSGRVTEIQARFSF